MSLGAARDGWRLAVGTLTAFPVAPPTRVGRDAAIWMAVLAPLAAVPLAAGVVVVGALAAVLGAPPLVAAFVALGAVAYGNRGLHLDGLSDTADGLAASFDRDRSLAVMKSGTSGPAGVVATLVVVGAQAAALASLLSSPGGVLVGATAVCVSRAALSLGFLRSFPPARTDGLGLAVCQSTRLTIAALQWLVLAGVFSVICHLGGMPWWRGGLAALVAVWVVLLLLRRATRRLGGVTGDVFGAAIEACCAVLIIVVA